MSEARDIIPFPGVGVFYDLAAHVYHKIDAVSATALKTTAVSCRHEEVRRSTIVIPSDAMVLGTCVHTATLEPEKLDTTVLIAQPCGGYKQDGSKCVNNGKMLSGGIWYCGVHGKKKVPDPLPKLLDDDENLIEAPIITQEKFDQAVAMARSTRFNRFALGLLTSPTAKMEASFFWIEEVTIFPGTPKEQLVSVPCKMRTDIYDPSFEQWGPTISDLKSCQCSDRPEFENDIADRRYDIQGAWYLDGATKALGGMEHKHFNFIAIESPLPHICCCYKMDAGLLDSGRSDYRYFLRLLTECKAEGYWPGYADHQIRPIGRGGYAFRRLDQEMKRDNRINNL